MRKLSLVYIALIIGVLFVGVSYGVNNGTPFDNNSGEFFESIEEISGENENVLYSGEVVDSQELKEEIEEVVQTDKDKNIMLFGQELDVKGEAKDLIMAMGAKVTSKALGSYAFMAASELNISGEIFNDTFVLGNEINVSGNIGRDFYALGNSITIDGTIERDAYIGAEELIINGIVNGDIKFAGKDIYISSNAEINGNVDVSAQEVEIKDGAKISGTFSYPENVEKIAIPQYITTKVNRVDTVVAEPTENSIISTIKDILWWVAANSILFLVIMLILPGFFKRIDELFAENTMQKYLSTFGWGLLSLIVIPIVSIIAIFTFIGSAVGLIGILLYIIGFMCATIIFAYSLGSVFFAGKNINKVLKGIIGIVVVEIITRLPIIGGIISLISVSVAFGIVIKIIAQLKSKKEEVGNNPIDSGE